MEQLQATRNEPYYLEKVGEGEFSFRSRTSGWISRQPLLIRGSNKHDFFDRKIKQARRRKLGKLDGVGRKLLVDPRSGIFPGLALQLPSTNEEARSCEAVKL